MHVLCRVGDGTKVREHSKCLRRIVWLWRHDQRRTTVAWFIVSWHSVVLLLADVNGTVLFSFFRTEQWRANVKPWRWSNLGGPSKCRRTHRILWALEAVDWAQLWRCIHCRKVKNTLSNLPNALQVEWTSSEQPACLKPSGHWTLSPAWAFQSARTVCLCTSDNSNSDYFCKQHFTVMSL
jgi:hypothetical protein